jgi:F0F1-type ATP synthase assembly protein I
VNDSDKPNKATISAARYISIASMLPASTFVGYAIGYGLDHWLGTQYLKIVFLILGIVAGFTQLVRQLMTDIHEQK